MSLLRPVLNSYLRLVEKPRLARAEGPEQMRANLEMQARYFFHAPVARKNNGRSCRRRAARSRRWRSCRAF
ncbi:hypothetical protein ACFQFQ_18975 [Sulfitobacter porphyrae]|uniref:Uncharacterized protein n=1 Tax=Sulfitobacter porphyrae TaxID=1246864 RepID=A0ABW2B5T9_9RHOB